MPGLKGFRRTLQMLGAKMVTRADRWPVAGLTAHYGVEFPSTPATIKNISSSGIFLGVQERLPVGQLVTLELQMDGDPELSSELQISLQAKIVRQDEFGVGLMFVQLPGLDADLWEVLVRSAVVLTDRDQVVHVFSTLRTVLFLCRLCQSGAEEAILLLDGRLDQHRTATLFKIARAVENLLLADPDADRMRAHPALVASLLRDGSWASDELTTQLWVGLFVSSCSVDEPDDSNQILVDLLIQITPHQAIAFTHACERALSSAPASGDLTSVSVVLGPDEIKKLTGMVDLSRCATDLAYLYNLGLIRKLFDFTSYREIDTFDITPTRLGFELYSHCHGQRGKIDPQLAASAREHLAALIPAPLPSVWEYPAPPVPDSSQEK